MITLDYQPRQPSRKREPPELGFWIEFCIAWILGLLAAYEIFGGDLIIIVSGLLIIAPLVAILCKKRKISQGWAIACGFMFPPAALFILLILFLLWT